MRGLKYFSDNDHSIATHNDFDYSFVSSTSTVIVNSGAAIIHAITITETASGNTTIYDNIAANGNVLALLKPNIIENTYFFNTKVNTGITVKTEANNKLTLVYKR